MKKIYITPNLNVVRISMETSILSVSGERFEVGMSKDVMKGAEALSGKKDMWGNEDIWK